MRDHFESLPAASYPVQNSSDLWTFHTASSLGALLTPSSGYYINAVDPAQTLGSLVDIGTNGCSLGFCPAVPSNTLATFDGVFVHSGLGTATTAVFRAQGDVVLDEIKLWSEAVLNANNGNGFAVTVNAIIDGVGSLLGSFTFDYNSTLTNKDERIFTPGLTLQAGDVVEIMYGNRGSYLFDHGNVEVLITTSPAASVPEPATLAILVLGFLGLSVGSRKRTWQFLARV